MSPEGDKAAAKNPPLDKGRRLTPDAEVDAPASASIDELAHASHDLKKRIDEEKRRHDMPVDSKLGNPDWEERAADGRFDLPDKDDD